MPNATALGIGDILITCALIKHNLLSIPVIINENYFLTKATYPNPKNAIDFRVKLINEIIKYNDMSKDSFIIKRMNNLYLDQHLALLKTFSSFSLNLNFNKKEINEPYIIFHTKCRFLGSLREQTDNNIIILKKFYKEFQSKYKLIILGERKMVETPETIFHGIKTIYNELLLLKENNDVIDLSTESIYNNLNYDNYLKDISIIHHANYNIHFGINGQFASSLAFSNNVITFIPDELVKLTNFTSDTFFNNIDNYMNFINNSCSAI
jgi:hypothetical protein